MAQGVVVGDKYKVHCYTTIPNNGYFSVWYEYFNNLDEAKKYKETQLAKGIKADIFEFTLHPIWEAVG